MYLIQNIQGNTEVHGVADTVSELIEFYFGFRKQWGAMIVVNEEGQTLATLGSEL